MIGDLFVSQSLTQCIDYETVSMNMRCRVTHNHAIYNNVLVSVVHNIERNIKSRWGIHAHPLVVKLTIRQLITSLVEEEPAEFGIALIFRKEWNIR